MAVVVNHDFAITFLINSNQSQIEMIPNFVVFSILVTIRVVHLMEQISASNSASDCKGTVLIFYFKVSDHQSVHQVI